MAEGDSYYVYNPVAPKGKYSTKLHRTTEDSYYVYNPVAPKGKYSTKLQWTTKDSYYVYNPVAPKGKCSTKLHRTTEDIPTDPDANFTDDELEENFKLYLQYGKRGNDDPNFEWPHQTILYCSMFSMLPIRCISDSKHHAEDLLLSKLKKKCKNLSILRVGYSSGVEETEKQKYSLHYKSYSREWQGPLFAEKTIKMNITQSYSPCNACALKYIHFMEDCNQKYNFKIQMCISFGTFYKFYIKENKKGLIKLLNKGVCLKLINERLRTRIEILTLKKFENFKVPNDVVEKWLLHRKKRDDLYMKKITLDSLADTLGSTYLSE